MFANVCHRLDHQTAKSNAKDIYKTVTNPYGEPPGLRQGQGPTRPWNRDLLITSGFQTYIMQWFARPAASNCVMIRSL